MATRQAVQSALAIVTKTKLATSTTRVGISSMVRLESTSDVHYSQNQAQRTEDIGRAEVFRAAIGHPLQDYVPSSDATNFIVSWPAHDDNPCDSLTRRMLNTLEGIRQSTAIQVTSPFYVMDGRGDKMASICIVPSQSKGSETDASVALDDWRSQEHWIDCHGALNQ